MSYDEALAERVRSVLGRRKGVTEKEMFGGVAWMLGGHMTVCVMKDDLMVRVGPAAHDAVLAQPHTRIMDFTGRPMKGYVFVAPAGFKTGAALAEWIERGAAFTRTLPRKKPSR